MNRIAIIFPKDSEALFNKNSKRTFGGASVQLYLIAKYLKKYSDNVVYSLIPDYQSIDFDEEKYFTLVKTFKENDSLIKKVLCYHKIIKTIRPNIIIQRGLTFFSCLLSLYCKIFNIKFIFMFAHDIETHGRYQNSRKKCFLFPLLLKTLSVAVVHILAPI